MYMKKVCVVSNVIGNKDVIHNGENGFVCNREDEFVEAIMKIKENSVEEVYNRAFEDIINTYNTQIMAPNYSQIYIWEMKKRESGADRDEVLGIRRKI